MTTLAPFFAALMVLSWLDVRTGRLPDIIVLPTLWAGLFLNTTSFAVVPAAAAIQGAACGYLSLQILSLTYRTRTGAPSFGGGDLKLAAMIGAWLGIDALPGVLLVAFVSGAIAAVVVPILLRRLRLDQKIPFGPALAAGAVLTALLGPSLSGVLAL